MGGRGGWSTGDRREEGSCTRENTDGDVKLRFESGEGLEIGAFLEGEGWKSYGKTQRKGFKASI